MPSTTDTITTTVSLNRDLWRRVKVLAAREDKSAAQWVREAIKLVVERVEGDTPESVAEKVRGARLAAEAAQRHLGGTSA